MRDHLERLHRSAQLLYLDLPYSVDELKAAAWDVIGANELPSCYLRPIAFVGYGELGVSAVGNPVDVAIMLWEWGAYLGPETGQWRQHDASRLIEDGLAQWSGEDFCVSNNCDRDPASAGVIPRDSKCAAIKAERSADLSLTACGR